MLVFGDLEMVMRGFSNGIPGSDESCIEMNLRPKFQEVYGLRGGRRYFSGEGLYFTSLGNLGNKQDRSLGGISKLTR